MIPPGRWSRVRVFGTHAAFIFGCVREGVPVTPRYLAHLVECPSLLFHINVSSSIIRSKPNKSSKLKFNATYAFTSTLITEVSIPIAVTFYLLHRIEGKLNTLIESIHSLPEMMN